MAIADGTKSVTAAGTPEKLVATETWAAWVELQAHADTTTAAVVGSANIVQTVDGAGRGYMLYPPTASRQPNSIRIPGPIDLQTIYVDAVTNGDGVYFIYDTEVKPQLVKH